MRIIYERATLLWIACLIVDLTTFASRLSSRRYRPANRRLRCPVVHFSTRSVKVNT
jgi:hypothetical protein